MELRQHLGIMVIMIMIALLIWAWDKDWERGYKIYVPFAAATMLWAIGEIFYWIIRIMIF